jgi:hypothetical protein
MGRLLEVRGRRDRGKAGGQYGSWCFIILDEDEANDEVRDDDVARGLVARLRAGYLYDFQTWNPRRQRRGAGWRDDCDCVSFRVSFPGCFEITGE